MLADLQRRQSALMAHQYLGLPEVQRLAGPGAVFDTLVVYENYPLPSAAPPRPGRATSERTPPTAGSRPLPADRWW